MVSLLVSFTAKGSGLRVSFPEWLNFLLSFLWYKMDLTMYFKGLL